MAIERGEDCHREDFEIAACGPFFGGFDNMGVSVDGEEIQIILCNSANGGFDCGPDVKEFHIQKDTFAMFLFQLIGQGKAAPCEHAETDFIE